MQNWTMLMEYKQARAATNSAMFSLMSTKPRDCIATIRTQNQMDFPRFVIQGNRFKSLLFTNSSIGD